jgi:hypothetical protein
VCLCGVFVVPGWYRGAVLCCLRGRTGCLRVQLRLAALCGSVRAWGWGCACVYVTRGLGAVWGILGLARGLVCPAGVLGDVRGV